MIISQNNEYPEYIFIGINTYKGRIIGDSTIYRYDGKTFDKVYFCEVNHNIFPQFTKGNKSELRCEAIMENRFELA